MNESERLERLKDNLYLGESNYLKIDQEFVRICTELLNHPDIDESSLVDAYYYDFSVIPNEIQQSLKIWRDCYLIFGVTNKGQIVSKWVDKYGVPNNQYLVGKMLNAQ